MLPQYIYFILVGVSLLMSAHKHGKKIKDDVNNFWVDLSGYIVFFVLLYWGGFFRGLF